MNDSDAVAAGEHCTKHNQHIFSVPKGFNECKSSSDSVSSFSNDLSFEKFSGQKTTVSPSLFNGITFSESSSPIIVSPQQMNSCDDELEYILGKGERSRVCGKTSADDYCQDTSTSNEVRDVLSLKTPIIEDTLSFEEYPKVQSSSSSSSLNLSLSPINPLTSTFPSDARDYTYFSTEDIDYCNEIFGIKNSSSSKDMKESGDKIEIFNTSRHSNEPTPRAHSPFGRTRAVYDSITSPTGIKDGASFKGLSAPTTAAASQYFSGASSKHEHILVTPSSSFMHVGTVHPINIGACPPLPPVAATVAAVTTTAMHASTSPPEYQTQQSKTAAHSNSKSDIAWNQRYTELQQFKQTHGHCNVPQKYEKNKSLGAWVARNRLFMRQFEQDNGTLRTSAVQCERMRRLEKIGLVACLGKGAFGRTNGHLMSSRNARDWENQFNTLQEYKAIHGDCDVPVKSETFKSLGRWVSAQRKKYHQYFGEGADGKTPSNDLVLRFERMKDLGFNFVIGSGKAKRVKLAKED